MLLITTVACSVVPFSNRKRINIVPDNMMLNMSFTNYSEFLTQNPPMPASNTNTKMVKDVGNKLATAVSSYLKSASSFFVYHELRQYLIHLIWHKIYCAKD